MGKTRLLDEFEARLQSYAVRKVRITLDAEMHEVPGAMLTAVVRALGLLSGAAGITADAAAILVRLTPDLQPRFSGVKPWEGPLALAATTGAVRDLLQAVAEELGVPGHEDFMVRMATVGLHLHRLVEMEALV